MARGVTANATVVKRGWGFTLVEMLVVVAIIAVLVSLLMTGLRGVRHQADSLVCKSNLKQIAFDFNNALRDPSELRRPGPKYDPSSFSMSSFIDKVYLAGAYFEGRDAGRSDEAKEHGRGEQLFFCPAGGSSLEVHETTQVLNGPPFETVRLAQQVSYAFNARLRVIYRPKPGDSGFIKRYVRLNENMLHWPMAPKTALVLDVDSRAATKAGVSPHEVAPPIEPGGEYMALPPQLAEGNRWFPGRRHDGRTNVALLDGSVLCERDMLASSNSINWADARYAGQWVNGVYQGDPDLLQSYWPDDALVPAPDH